MIASRISPRALSSRRPLDHARALRRALAACSIAMAVQACAHAPAAGADSRPGRSAAVPSAGALLTRGVSLLQAGDALRAEQYLTLAVRAGAPESRAIVPLVQACAASSRLQSALEHALPYLRRHPDAWPLRYVVAAIQLALGRNELAQGELERVRAAAPEFAPAHYLAAVIARDRLGDAGAAVVGFAEYVRHAPRGEHAAEARAFLREHPAAEPRGAP